MQTTSMTDRLAPTRQIALLLAGVGVLTASSYVAVPMVPVPVTMQTLAVLLVGALAGPRMGLAMIVSCWRSPHLAYPFSLAARPGCLPLPARRPASSSPSRLRVILRVSPHARSHAVMSAGLQAFLACTV